MRWLLPFLALGSCGLPRDVDGTSERIAARHTIRVGLDGKLDPVAARFLGRIEQATGAKVQIEKMALEQLVDRLDTDRIDLLIAPIRADALLAEEIALSPALEGEAAEDRPVALRAAVRNGENRVADDGRASRAHGERQMSDITLPTKLRAPMRQAMRLEYWNIFWSATIIAAIGLTTGQSQTMKTAWVEDMVGLVPPIAFLIAAHFELKHKRSRKFPFGFERTNGLGFFVAAVALFAVGAQLLYDAVATLIEGEHASVGSVVIFGETIWLGWLMIAAQVYAMIPPFLIGRKELPLAHKLNDKLLHTDALMNKANWMTGAAGVAGIVGLGLGWWWADSVAAAAISASILKDGFASLRAATAELVDGKPRSLEGNEVAEDAQALQKALEKRFPGATVRLRETGRVIRAEVHDARAPRTHIPPEEYWPGDPARAWRLAQVSFVPADPG